MKGRIAFPVAAWKKTTEPQKEQLFWEWVAAVVMNLVLIAKKQFWYGALCYYFGFGLCLSKPEYFIDQDGRRSGRLAVRNHGC